MEGQQFRLVLGVSELFIKGHDQRVKIRYGSAALLRRELDRKEEE